MYNINKVVCEWNVGFGLWGAGLDIYHLYQFIYLIQPPSQQESDFFQLDLHTLCVCQGGRFRAPKWLLIWNRLPPNSDYINTWIWAHVNYNLKLDLNILKLWWRVLVSCTKCGIDKSKCFFGPNPFCTSCLVHTSYVICELFAISWCWICGVFQVWDP